MKFMKKIITLLLVLSSLVSFSQSTTLVISQVYGAGGNSGALYNADYVELHNISSVSQSLSGLSIQYGSATVSAAWSGVFALPNVSIPAGGYYLIQMSSPAGTVGSAFTADVVVPAATSINMSGSNGRVALVNGTTALNACPAASAYIDFVGYGTSTCFEGSAAVPALSSTTAALRKNNGCTETNNNSADFSVLAPSPRNLASPAVSCGPAGPAITATPTSITNFGNVNVGANSSSSTFSVSGTNLSPASGNLSVTAPAEFEVSLDNSSWTVNPVSITYASGTVSSITVYVRFKPQSAGAKSGNVTITGGGVSTAVNVAVSGTGVASSAPSVSTGSSSAITLTSATLAGNISADGCSAVSAYGIEYSTTNNFTPGTGTMVASTNISGGNFSVNISGLTLATTYYYRAYATNTCGTAYGGQSSFATLTPVLTATPMAGFGFADVCINSTDGPDSLTISGTNLTTAAITVGPLAPFSFSTSYAGTYSASLSLTQPGGTFSQKVYVKFSPVAVQSYNGSIPVAGAGAASISAAVTANGVNTPPTVVTGRPTDSTFHTATINASIASTGCSPVSESGIEYSGIKNFVSGTGTKVRGNLDAAGVNVTTMLSGLVQGVKYYYRAYAVNNGGTAYGAQDSVSTMSIDNGLVIYGNPLMKGGKLHFSVANIIPGSYHAIITNLGGQVVAQKNMIIGINFIDDELSLPGSMASGVYNFKLINTMGFSIVRQIQVL